MKCPVCQELDLVEQSAEDAAYDTPDIYCPKYITLPGGKRLNHYRVLAHYGWDQNVTRILIPPYRILIQEKKTTVSIQSQYKTGKAYFKAILKLSAPLHADTEEKLLTRIKTLLVFS